MVDEPEERPYYLAARFTDEKQASRDYFRIQTYVQRHSAQLELSVYRFLLPNQSGDSIVAVVGLHPGEETDKRLKRALSSGERTELDDQTLRFLQERRAQEIRQGPWVERHYRPGRGFNLDM